MDRDLEQRARFLALARHRLKTPLTVLSGWSTTLQDWEVLGPGDRQEGLEAIHRAAADLESQIEDLFEEARMHLLAQRLHLEQIELRDAVAEAVATFGADPDRHPVTNRVPEGVTVAADRVALGHVVERLLDNARRFSPDGGAIEISAEVGEDAVAVLVADQGGGLPDDPDLFEPFHRGHRASDARRGTGLGLYVVRSLVRAMGGEVGARNAGGGAVVEFSLPRP